MGQAGWSPSSPESQLLPRTRRELTATQQIFDGQPYWVVKDPVSLRYYRFSREEYFIIKQLERGVTLDELKAAHREEFKTDQLTNDEVGGFVRQLAASNIVNMQQRDRDEILYTKSRRRWRMKFKAQVSNFMFLKIPIFDPDKLLTFIHRYVSFFWTRSFFLLYMVMIAVALGLLIHRWHEFSGMYDNLFLTVRNLPMLMVVIWIIKALHEFGHGLTCKNYGGEVHEMGWLFMVFFPFFYCNVSDSWTFPDKRHRLLVTAGGIFTELMFASAAVVIWYFTETESFIHSLSYNVIMACSLGTILFNMNPLLKFDGYYILMDLVEIPNLRQRASQLVERLWIRYIFGGESTEMPEEHRYRYIFPAYAIAALAYRWFITFVILFRVHDMFSAVGLVWLAYVVIAVSMVMMIFRPAYKNAAKIVHGRVALGISNTRLIVLLVILVLVVGGILFCPIEQHVTLNFILEPSKLQWLRVETAGELEWDECVHEGAWVGQQASGSLVVAHLTNPELRFERIQLDSQIKQVDIMIADCKALGLSNELARFNEHASTLKQERDNLARRIDNLEVKAPFEGRVLLPERALIQQRTRFLEQGSPLFLLGDTNKLMAKVWVPEKTWARIFKRDSKSARKVENDADINVSTNAGTNVNTNTNTNTNTDTNVNTDVGTNISTDTDQKVKVETGQAVELMLYAFSDNKFHGRVVAVNMHSEDSMGQYGEKMALSHKVGGEVVTRYDPIAQCERPVEAVYEVTIMLDPYEEMPSSARAYMSGRARISCRKSTLYQWGRDSLLRLISLDVWL